jgi:hypothetical protein
VATIWSLSKKDANRLDHLRVGGFAEVVPVGRVKPVPDTSPPFRGRTATPTLGNVYVSDALRG